MSAAARARNVFDLLEFVGEYRSGAKARVEARLAPDVVAELAAATRTSWLAIERDSMVVDSVVEEFGSAGSIEMWRAFTRRFSESKYVRPLFETAVRLGGLKLRTMAEQTPRIWDASFRDVGEMEVIDQDDRSMVVMLTDVHPVLMEHAGYSLLLQGMYRGLHDMTKSEDRMEFRQDVGLRMFQIILYW